MHFLEMEMKTIFHHSIAMQHSDALRFRYAQLESVVLFVCADFASVLSINYVRRINVLGWQSCGVRIEDARQVLCSMFVVSAFRGGA